MRFSQFLLLTEDIMALLEELDPQVRRNRKKMIEYYLTLNNYSYWNAGHAMEVARIARDFGKFMGLDANRLAASALTHDTGKINVDKVVLHKPDALTHDERKHIDTHVDNTVLHLDKLTGEHGNFAKIALLYHHSKPTEIDKLVASKKLTYEEAELAKIVTICDIFEALVSEKRPYKKPITKYDALVLMRSLLVIDQDILEHFTKWQLQEFANEYRAEYVERERERLEREYKERKELYKKQYDHYVRSTKNSPRKYIPSPVGE